MSIVVGIGAFITGLAIGAIGVSIHNKLNFRDDSFEDKLERIMANIAGIIETKSFNKLKPFLVKNKKKNLKTLIKNRVVKSINDELIDYFVLNNSEKHLVVVSVRLFKDLPMLYRSPFQLLFNEVVIDVIKQYENKGYKIESEYKGKDWYLTFRVDI